MAVIAYSTLAVSFLLLAAMAFTKLGDRRPALKRRFRWLLLALVGMTILFSASQSAGDWRRTEALVGGVLAVVGFIGSVAVDLVESLLARRTSGR